MRTIKVCAGIGDNIWLLQKLINSGERFHFHLPNGKPQRGKQIFDLLPQVAASAEYVSHLSYKTLARLNVQNALKYWQGVRHQEFYLSCNEHLEQGRRLETFFPDLPTSFRIPWQTDAAHQVTAEYLTPDATTSAPGRPGHAGKYIGIYGSAYSTQRAWGFWDEHGWLRLIELVHQRYRDFTFVIIGAEWDLDLGQRLISLLEQKAIPYVNTIGYPLGVVIEIMKRLTYFFSFPSGLGILAPTVSCPVTMFYPKHLELMMNAWASPEDIRTGLYKGCQFCSPEAIFEWVVANKKLDL